MVSNFLLHQHAQRVDLLSADSLRRSLSLWENLLRLDLRPTTTTMLNASRYSSEESKRWKIKLDSGTLAMNDLMPSR